MHPNQQLIERFYEAFARLEDDAMARCYAPEATFEDEVFSLRGHREVTGMWSMLCDSIRTQGRDVWKLEFSGVTADTQNGRAHWEAHYRFSATGRLVHNIIDAEFTFTPDGLIATQRDRFNFWRWSRQALGAPGVLLGWTPMLHAKVRSQAGANLRKFLASRSRP